MENRVESLRREAPELEVDTPKRKRRKKPELDGRRRKKKRRRRIILIILAVILLVVGLFLGNIYRRASVAFNRMFEPLESTNIREDRLRLGRDSFSILILGLDEGRADSIMVATVSRRERSTYLLSIARDTRVEIPGHGVTRINHAYAYGGIDLMANTVQDFLNIPIDYHMSLYMGQFHQLVDAFGGVRVHNDTVAFSMGGYDFPLGYVNLTGSSAYYYVRMRFDDPRGDFGRQERQRDVLGAMANELAGPTLITRHQQILDSVGDHLRTSITLNDTIWMTLRYHRALRNITNLYMLAPGQIENGMYLIAIPEDQRLAMSNRLRSHLGLD